MSKIALMTLSNQADSLLSDHFGKAEWILIHDSTLGTSRFLRNDGLNGRSAAELLLREGCSNVILREIGMGALAHLRAGQIHAWLATESLTISAALQMFAAGLLQEVVAALGHQDGCGCSHPAQPEAAAPAQEKHCCGGCR